MKLHTVTGSPNCRRVEAVISHLNLSVEVEHHDFAALRGPQFTAINPNGRVPVLVDGAFTLTESNAIMQYLADKAGNNALFPREPQARADVARWQFWEALHFNKAFGALAFEIVAKPNLNLGPADVGTVDAAKAGLARFAPVLERRIEGRKYIVGDTITIADYAVATFEAYRTKLPFDWSPFPAINAYFDRVGASEHWLRTRVDRKKAA